jgi:hypothetical protein
VERWQNKKCSLYQIACKTQKSPQINAKKRRWEREITIGNCKVGSACKFYWSKGVNSWIWIWFSL